MPDDKTPTLGQGLQTPTILIGNPAAPAFYPSVIRLVMSTFDISFFMGQLCLDALGNPEIREIGRIYFSPQHAKSLALLLPAKIAEYEAQFGPIPDQSLMPQAQEALLSGDRPKKARGKASAKTT